MWHGGVMIRGTKTAAAFVLVAVLVAGCGWVSKSVEILDVGVSEDGLTLELSVATCSADLSIEIQEDRETVAVWVSAKDGADADCSDGVTIELMAPFGDRMFIDGHDFTEIDVRVNDS